MRLLPESLLPQTYRGQQFLRKCAVGVGIATAAFGGFDAAALAHGGPSEVTAYLNWPWNMVLLFLGVCVAFINFAGICVAYGDSGPADRHY